MDVELLDDPARFLEVSVALRAADPIRTNVLGSVAQSVATGDRRYERCWWWVVRDRGTVVGIAMRTAPFPLALSPMGTAAAAALAGAVTGADPAFPGANGQESTVRALLDALPGAGDQRRWRVASRQLIYELGTLQHPRVPGRARVATEADADVVVAWTEAFHDEIGGHHDEEAVRNRVAAATTYLWIDGDEIVSLAGHAVPVEVPSGVLARVGPVYTPPARRRHGYAGAVTAACSAALLARGARVMLYTDADNPTSNGVYMGIGYQLVGDAVAYEPD